MSLLPRWAFVACSRVKFTFTLPLGLTLKILRSAHSVFLHFVRISEKKS